METLRQQMLMCRQGRVRKVRIAVQQDTDALGPVSAETRSVVAIVIAPRGTVTLIHVLNAPATLIVDRATLARTISVSLEVARVAQAALRDKPVSIIIANLQNVI